MTNHVDFSKLASHFLYCCEVGHLDKVKALFGVPSFSYAQTQDMMDNALKYACGYGQLEVVKFLLFDPLMKTARFKPDMTLLRESHFYLACETGHLPVVKYLLESEDLPRHHIARPQAQSLGNYAFRAACAGKYAELIDYFIFECRVPYDTALQNYCQSYPHVHNKFLYRELQTNLSHTSENGKKSKI